MAKCPHCNQPVSRVNLNEVKSSALFGTSWRTIIYSCPLCEKVLSVQIDPVALKTDIIDALQNR